MSCILLTFLGRVPKNEQGYRLTRYDYGDGRDEPPTAFFGWSLQQRLTPDRMVILGTAGSMWDHLFEGDEAFYEAGDAADKLTDAVKEKRVTFDHLAPLTPLLTARLGCEVCLDIIPYARDSTEQVDLLRIMAAHVNAGDRVDLDVTHGFRHLPMLAILAALHLRSVRRAEIGGIWYGAYDPDTREAPVHDLSGLLHIADWLQALHTYDKDGDYGVFASLIDNRACPRVDCLRQAAFYEQVNNIGQARGPLREFRQDLTGTSQDPLLKLFPEELLQRTAWVENRTLAERQYEMAKHFLEFGDYLRAAILGFESLLTRLVQAEPGQLDPMNHEHREQVKKQWDDRMRGPSHQRSATQQAYLDLREFRNVLAHGSRSKFGSIQDALSSGTKLRDALSRAIELAHQGART